MHGASLPSADAGLLAKELCHDASAWDALAERVHVITIGGADEVILPERLSSGQ